uniref:pentapeptide repeat-containing protein n=1 Tax=Pedobacter schmidteae TaxID=2201271 RepID=UPI001D02D27C|nr:pentapeptide repeat-containing protein [Pedobacter schmidteae]
MIGNKIASARKKINISQAQLAERLFISPQAVGKWERGESFPDILTFNRLAEILGVDLNYFSGKFHSTTTEKAIDTLVVNRPERISLEKPKNKTAWDMSSGNWEGVDFSGLKNLQEKFSSSNIQNCLFCNSDLSGLMLKSNNVDRCDFSGSDISSSHFKTSNLANNVFKNCSLNTAEFSKSHIQGCDFSGSDMSNSQFQTTYLDKNIFKDCSWSAAEFLKSYMNGCDFSGANFTGTVFKSGGFANNIIVNAIWNGTSFIGMHLEDIVFDGVLEDCHFENCVFNWVKFEQATLKNTFLKNNRFKQIRVRFVDCKADPMTYGFLKTAKADLSGLTLLT